MQIYMLVLVIALFLHDQTGGPADALIAASHPWLTLLLISMPLGSVLYALACWRVLLKLQRRKGHGMIRWLDRVTRFYHIWIIASWLFVLAAGGLVATRNAMDDLILVDELLLLAVPILMFIWGWACYYPIDRWLRHASAGLGLFDDPASLHIWTRSQYILVQFRHQMAIVLVPLLLLLGWIETVEMLSPTQINLFYVTFDPRIWLQIAGTVAIFIAAPAIIRRVWDTQPLSPGPLRQRLEAMCRMHNVRVRELLVWKTFGTMINAAVMGAWGRLRYILMTDAMLATMPSDEVEAVMAHELAHVRRRHFLWVLLAASSHWACFFALAALVVEAFFVATVQAALAAPTAEAVLASSTVGQVLFVVACMLAAGGWYVSFGWVSRRLERQADTFAVQHLSRQFAALEPDPDPNDPPRIHPAAVDIMTSALQRVADLNHLPSEHFSWRHGSIASRQRHLHTLIGTTIEPTDIDRVVFRINLSSLLLWLIILAIHLVGGLYASHLMW